MCSNNCKERLRDLSSSCTSEAQKTNAAPLISLCTECGSGYEDVMAEVTVCVAIQINASNSLPLCHANCQPLACRVFNSCRPGSSVNFLGLDGPGLALFFQNMSSQMSTCPCWTGTGFGCGGGQCQMPVSGAMGSQTSGLASALLALLSLLSLLSL
ncbi:unnamed protein product [Polarella glacialis]|uniref:Uncharacterized protein n=1 Tax=Polarella glacialis TaxID=89957 RepID=A0A813KMB2_POLGL|nr:unnamed protein product [Polarella glacialis]